MQNKTLITIHLPMDMEAIGKILMLMGQQFPNCIVREKEGTGNIEVVEAVE